MRQPLDVFGHAAQAKLEIGARESEGLQGGALGCLSGGDGRLLDGSFRGRGAFGEFLMGWVLFDGGVSVVGYLVERSGCGIGPESQRHGLCLPLQGLTARAKTGRKEERDGISEPRDNQPRRQ